MSIPQSTRYFFESCDTGQGWEACKALCHGSASSAYQADTLTDVNSLADYAQWMKGLLGPIPDGAFIANS